MDKELKILQERAKLLAREPEKPADGNFVSVATFMLGSETYGFENVFITEVLPRQKIIPIPCTPAFVVGIINVRSRIVSVLDPRKLFDLEGSEAEGAEHIVILNDGKIEVALLVGAIAGVVQVNRDTLDTSLTTFSEEGVDFLKGVSPEGIIVVDAAGFLGSEKIIVHDTM